MPDTSLRQWANQRERRDVADFFHQRLGRGTNRRGSRFRPRDLRQHTGRLRPSQCWLVGIWVCSHQYQELSWSKSFERWRLWKYLPCSWDFDCLHSADHAVPVFFELPSTVAWVHSDLTDHYAD